AVRKDHAMVGSDDQQEVIFSAGPNQPAQGRVQRLHCLQIAAGVQIMAGAVHRSGIDQHDEWLSYEMLYSIRRRIQCPGVVAGIACHALTIGISSESVPPFLKEGTQALWSIGPKSRCGLSALQGV